MAGSLQGGVLLPVGDTLVAGQGARLAGIDPLRGTQYFAAAQIQTEITAKITIRWRDGGLGRVHDCPASYAARAARATTGSSTKAASR